MSEAKLASALARLAVIRAEKAADASAAKASAAKPNGNEEIPAQPTKEDSDKIREEIIQAGIDGGFYDREDDEYSNVVRDESKKKPS